mmetsp:Transcript_38339/g.113689  ORF Transcript_38339/g.113689 Transcript_38339/m.113689 type:complete len:166 (-) Transcript_38339:39-536(-)
MGHRRQPWHAHRRLPRRARRHFPLRPSAVAASAPPMCCLAPPGSWLAEGPKAPKLGSPLPLQPLLLPLQAALLLLQVPQLLLPALLLLPSAVLVYPPHVQPRLFPLYTTARVSREGEGAPLRLARFRPNGCAAATPCAATRSGLSLSVCLPIAARGQGGALNDCA